MPSHRHGERIAVAETRIAALEAAVADVKDVAAWVREQRARRETNGRFRISSDNLKTIALVLAASGGGGGAIKLLEAMFGGK